MSTITTMTPPQRPAVQVRRPRDRARLIVGICVAIVVFALTALGTLGMLFAIPLIGIVLAWAAPGENGSRQVGLTVSTVILLVVALLCGAAVALLPYAAPFLLAAFGDRAALVVVSAVGALAVALPLALRESPASDGAAAPRRMWVTRRNVVLAFTGLVSLALVHNTGNTAIALLVLVLVLPVLIGVLRLWQARHGRVERRLWPQPFAPEFRWYRLHVVNQWVLLALTGATMVTGAYDLVRALLPASGYRILVDVAFVVGLVALAALATIPLKGVRLATNVLVLTCSIFLAGQIVWIYRPSVDPVTVSSPVSGDWYVVQGGRAELITST